MPDQAGEVESALGLWREIKQTGALPDADTCNALLIACTDCGQNERALKLFQSMPEIGEPPAPHIAAYHLCIMGSYPPCPSDLTFWYPLA